jgi:anti-sigma B factor antagonist
VGSALRVDDREDGVVAVAGDLDAGTADRLDRALRDREERHPDRPVVVDVGEVAFMDSSGLRALVAASLRAGRRGTVVRLHNVGAELARLLEITGLRDQFGVAARTADRPWRPSDHHTPRDDHPDHRCG